jgi:hypothetical protein
LNLDYMISLATHDSALRTAMDKKPLPRSRNLESTNARIWHFSDISISASNVRLLA